MNTKCLLNKHRILDYDLFIIEMESKEEERSNPVEKNIENKIKLTMIGKKKGTEKTICKTENKHKRKIKKKGNKYLKIKRKWRKKLKKISNLKK